MSADVTRAISDMLDDNAGSLGAAAVKYHEIKERLQIDHGGSDKIDELEQAALFSKHSADALYEVTNANLARERTAHEETKAKLAEEEADVDALRDGGLKKAFLARCYLRGIKNLRVQLAEVKRLSPGAICQRFRIQGCSWCECIDCNDNTSPAKTKLTEAEATLRRYGWRPSPLDCLGRETHGKCPRCTGALICIEACDLGDPKVCPRCGHEDHLSSHPDCPGVNRTVASGDLVPRGETEARLNEETNHHATLLDEFNKLTTEMAALKAKLDDFSRDPPASTEAPRRALDRAALGKVAIAPTRDDLEAIAVELAILKNSGCAGRRVDQITELYEHFEVNFETPPSHTVCYVLKTDVVPVWLERQGVVGLRHRVEILESKVADLVRNAVVR
jgi:hypothetical protein